ncbi:MAG: hypothetical protein ABSB35_19920 [Bryobacteraceae bacterium]
MYRAHDHRLRRDVAIKVSAERFSERFEKEARAIASLNHTNVCTLHDRPGACNCLGSRRSAQRTSECWD